MAGLEQFDVMGPREMGWGLMGGLGMEMACIQVSAPWALKREDHFISSADLRPSLLGIPIVAQITTSRVQSFMSLEALLTAPEMIF